MLVSCIEKEFSFILMEIFKGYYKPDPVKEYTEASEGGDYDFLSRLARDWEQASEPIDKKLNVRRVVLRSGILTRFI